MKTWMIIEQVGVLAAMTGLLFGANKNDYLLKTREELLNKEELKSN